MNTATVTIDGSFSDAAATLATIRVAHELAREEELERLRQELQELREQFVAMAARQRL
jgi:hypothetical protein